MVPVAHELLVVALGELLARALVGLVGLAAHHVAHPGVDEVGRGPLVRVLGEGHPRVGHGQGVVEHDHLALVAHSQLLEGGDDVEVHAGSVEGVVAADLRSGT